MSWATIDVDSHPDLALRGDLACGAGDGRSGSPFTGLTRPEPPSLGPAYGEALRQHALGRFGVDRAAVEREIEQRLAAVRVTDPDPLAIATRRSTGRSGGRALGVVPSGF